MSSAFSFSEKLPKYNPVDFQAQKVHLFWSGMINREKLVPLSPVPPISSPRVDGAQGQICTDCGVPFDNSG